MVLVLVRLKGLHFITRELIRINLTSSAPQFSVLTLDSHRATVCVFLFCVLGSFFSNLLRGVNSKLHFLLLLYSLFFMTKVAPGIYSLLSTFFPSFQILFLNFLFSSNLCKLCSTLTLVGVVHSDKLVAPLVNLLEKTVAHF